MASMPIAVNGNTPAPQVVRTKEPTMAELKLKIAQLEAAVAAKGQVKLTLKVGAKGGLSLYGLGRWPVTLYLSQWLALLSFVPQIIAFINEHRSELSVKA
jgi:hypothetical protein